MKKLLLFGLLISLASCMSEKRLVEKCKQIIPPCDSSHTETRIVNHTDTLWNTIPVASLPLVDIRCFTFTDSTKITFENATPVKVIPYPVVNSKETIYTTIYLKDSFAINEANKKIALLEVKLSKKAQFIRIFSWVSGTTVFLLFLLLLISTYFLKKKL